MIDFVKPCEHGHPEGACSFCHIETASYGNSDVVNARDVDTKPLAFMFAMLMPAMVMIAGIFSMVADDRRWLAALVGFGGWMMAMIIGLAGTLNTRAH